jgi:transcriptional regulator with PAS, ATPase and Fis domain
MGLAYSVTEFKKWLVWWTLERNDFNQSRAAKELGIHRNSLVRSIREWEWQELVHEGFEERHRHWRAA